ncbi:MAG: hypothetical protein OSB21_06180 [Myxococcota bacterium]|nr:hypothetical protein [Myxococcota bacterium]
MMRAFGAVFVVLSGCSALIPEPVSCESVCRAPLVCVQGMCQISEQQTVDAGSLEAGLPLLDGAAPSVDAGLPALDSGLLVDAGPQAIVPICGNQELEPGEDCDDGNDSDDDDCMACRWPTSASGGHRQSCLRVKNSLYCAGANTKGQLGDGSQEAREGFVQVPGNFIDVASMAEANCAVDELGAVLCWGDCAHGALGNGAIEGCQVQTQPVAVPGVSGAVQVVGGDWFACARLANGTVWCWGHNTRGSLGRGDNATSPVPAPVSGLTGVLKISAGGYHVCALDGLGAVYCWGQGELGQLGNDAVEDSVRPLRVDLPPVVQIASGGYQNCAIDRDKRLWCWGDNSFGQLGIGTDAPLKSTAQQVQLQAGVRPSQLFGGNRVSCLRDEQGSVWCAGKNDHSQLGQGPGDQRSYFSRIPDLTVSWFGSGSRSQTVFAATNPRQFMAWGSNQNGQLGVLDRADREQPTCIAVGPTQACP